MEYKILNFVILAAAASAILIGLSCADPHHSRHHEQKQQAGQTQRLTEGEQLSSSSNAGGSAGASSTASGDPPPSRYSEPFRAERINRGLSSIFTGLRSGSLEEILRGSFTFTRNENVRGVADNVLSGIFGTAVRNEGNLDAYGKLLNAGGGNNGNGNTGGASASSANARG